MTTSNIVKKLDLEDHFMVLNPSRPNPIKITPIPEPNILGNSVLGKSFLTEMYPYGCPCGKELGILSKEMSALSLSGKDFNSIATELNLIGCCRMRFLSPYILSVTSSDLSVVQRHTDSGDKYEDLEPPKFNL